MGLMDKLLAKQESSVNKKIVNLLTLSEPLLEAKLSTAVCQENAGWTHQSIEVQTNSGASLNFHRCRNVWFVDSGLNAQAIANVDLGGHVPAAAWLIATTAEAYK